MSRHYSHEINDLMEALDKAKNLLGGLNDERPRWLASKIVELRAIAAKVYRSDINAATWLEIRNFQLKEIQYRLADCRDRVKGLEHDEAEMLIKVKEAFNDAGEATMESRQ